jgi:membrane-bound lytic murein transglycosylase D
MADPRPESQSIVVRYEDANGAELQVRLSHPFRVGRGEHCDVTIASPLVSREHAAFDNQDGTWWVVDLGSTNGLIVDGTSTQRAELGDGSVVQLGPGAPTLRISLGLGLPGSASTTASRPLGTAAVVVGSGGGLEAAADESGSVDEAIEHYLSGSSSRPAGERTRLIRVAYQVAAGRQRRKFQWALGIVGGLALIALLYGGVQSVRNRMLMSAADAVFAQIREQDVLISRLRQVVEAQRNADLDELLADLVEGRERLREEYDVYVSEFGIYRKLKSTEERLIYRTARTFNESEFTISADFVRRVQEQIHDYWLTPTGRRRYTDAIELAQGSGYRDHIGETLRSRGLPAEFFYLAMQESDFDEKAIGPETRWGRAKGMWQFIPATAEAYGLSTGLQANGPGVPSDDERLDYRKATDAATRYLLALHGKLTQASGLLVMASYNWGERRVERRLESLPTPEARFAAEFQDVPTTATERNYWRFLEAYEDRMPEETRTYVLRIFAAAVIGRDPRHFGFDFDNPLDRFAD